MAPAPWLWIRHEDRPHERRAPVVPHDVPRLLDAGMRVTVEDSPHRAFGIERYVAAGADRAPAGSWVQAPEQVYVLGLKELPDLPETLRHRHILFGHAFKGQADATRLLRRFASGGGQLLDLESLVDASGRRVAAFGSWAGYVGAALAVLHHRGVLEQPLRPGGRADLDRSLAASATGGRSTALVIGALGRSGRGAVEALAAAGIEATQWDQAETAELDREALLGHDLLVSCVLATSPMPPFVTVDDLTHPGRRLSVIADVTCDVGSDLNVLPVNTELTTWEHPVRRLADAPVLDVIAIDNLPSLLPVESSTAFSAALLPHLLTLDRPGEDDVWQRALATFRSHVDDPGDSR